MYSKSEKKSFSTASIEKQLRQLAAQRIAQKWGTRKELEALKGAEDFHFQSVAKQVYELAKLIQKNEKKRGRYIWAVCEKMPRNLDSGKHYYSVYYTQKDGIDKFWPFDLWPIFRMESQDRDRQMYKYIFSSSAIGMSRLLDATDGLFTTLKKLTGCYAQIDTI